MVPQMRNRLDALMRPRKWSGVIAWRRLTLLTLYTVAEKPSTN